ncbi:hypothetical protein DESUT3_39380 [Desulfuromonas versatilis]|uniref:Capsule biosynthesis protein CapB n=1 Tax=Desulfuromonas versatilis TaxID=2802975 RepID=A0ABM8I0M3_9BACT|nr:hypothetical protein [Desulfuromonas versatilis]BCR06869.1 hypothetical protein DESUT3_39380 [Desulfuromonas versatilis]
MRKATEQAVGELLAEGLTQLWQRVEAARLKRLAEGFAARPAQGAEAGQRRPGAEAPAGESLARQLVRYLLQGLEQELDRRQQLERRHLEFVKRLGAAATEAERGHHVLEYARDLGSRGGRLRGDRRALDRWFGPDAVTDRYQRRLAESERQLAFLLDRIGAVSARLLAKEGESAGFAALWRRLELEKTVKPLLTHEGDGRVCIAAFRCLSRALRALPRADQQGALSEGVLQYIFRFAMEARQQVWLQAEALELLQSLDPGALARALEKRLNRPLAGNDLFVRRRAVELLGRNLSLLEELLPLVETAARDPSPFVRQALPAALRQAPAEAVQRWLPQLAFADEVPQVRGAALLAGLTLLERLDLEELVRQTLAAALEREQDPFVLRVACRVAAQAMERLIAADRHMAADAWRDRLVPVLQTLHVQAQYLPARRWAAQALETIWCLADPAASRLREALAGRLQRLRPGRRGGLPRRLTEGVDAETLGRVLALLAQEDYGLDLEPGALRQKLTRGHRFGFRLWRTLIELARPSSDKRESFPHTVGRIFRGRLRAPSAILAELAETKVPGEPLYIGEEGGWRPYLPLVDEVLSALDQGWLGGPVRLFTAEGVTEIHPPRSPLRRLRARATLTRDFRRYARLRNWQAGSAEPPDAYLKALGCLGYRFSFAPHGGTAAPRPVDPAVSRFFPALLPFFDESLWGRLKSYFFSLYENTLSDLVLFAGIGTTLFLGRQWWLERALRRARRALPLVIGGWGTRGKSGTERLKAALFNALGHAVVAKTTGCEAMFLHGLPFGPAREMFLFRPYDKATIWEQHNVVRLARRLGTEVFLYECMALTPAYVRIVRRWMRDDLSTITNTYPDHEDLQGPAGINIPEVMCDFIPENGVLCTSEEQMLPVLRQAAALRGTRVHSVGWLEAGLLTPDVLERFPYQEHPHNIALVLSLAAELGIPADFAIKEMADRVLPDLGVLKSFPAARLQGRRLEFVNGMSANERFATLSNWRRTGFDRHALDADPEVWVTTLVNNRGDRVPRSQVFAGLLASELSADRHVLIGTNLSGLLGYIRRAWRERLAAWTLWPEEGGADAGEIFRQAARWLRVPHDDAQVRGRLRAMLEGLGMTAEAPAELWPDAAAAKLWLQQAGAGEGAGEVARQLVEDQQRLEQYRQFARRLEDPGADRADLDAGARALLSAWFEAKLVVIEDPHASGDQIIQRICAATPPGLLGRIMGLQNIKGTGLGFVYAWQAWERCHQACTLLQSQEAAKAESGLRQLAAFQDFNLLCAERVREAIARVRPSPVAQRELFQAELEVIAARLEDRLHELTSRLHFTAATGLLIRGVEALEAFLDAGDAVRRRRQADRIYRDLGRERISHARAAIELQALNQRQKGGWLLGQVHSLKARLGLGLPAGEPASRGDSATP